MGVYEPDLRWIVFTTEEGGEWKYEASSKERLDDNLALVRLVSHTLLVVTPIHFESTDGVRNPWSLKEFSCESQ